MNKRSIKNNIIKTKKSKINGGKPTIPHDSCRQIMIKKKHKKPVTNIVFHLTLPILASSSYDKTLKIWSISDDYSSIDEKASIQLLGWRDLYFHPKLPIIDVHSVDNKSNIYSISSDYSRLNLLITIDAKINKASFHPTAPIIAIGSTLYTVSEDYSKLTIREQLFNDDNPIETTVQFHQTMPILIINNKGHEPRLWRVEQDNPSQFLNNLPIPKSGGNVWGLRFHPTLPFIVGYQHNFELHNIHKLCLWRISYDSSPSQFISYLTIPPPLNGKIFEWVEWQYVRGLNFHPILPIIIGYQTSEDSKSLNQVCIWSISSDNPIPYASVIPVDRSNKYYNTIGILKIHPSLPILAVIKERSNIVKIYKFSDNGSQVELIETLNNGESIVESIDFHPTQPILAIGSVGKTIKFWNCEILSAEWHKRNAITRSAIASTVIDKLTTLPTTIWQNPDHKKRFESDISHRIGAISKVDPDKVSKIADRFEEIGSRESTVPMEEVDGGANIFK